MKTFGQMTRAVVLTLLMLLLSGCSLAGYLLSGCGGESSDLIFYNDSSQTVGRVGVSLNGESRGVSAAREGAGLRRGESWGFCLPENEDSLLIEVFGPRGETLARGRYAWPGQGEQLWAVYDGDRTLRFSWEGR